MLLVFMVCIDAVASILQVGRHFQLFLRHSLLIAELALHFFDDAKQVRESLELVRKESDRCIEIGLGRLVHGDGTAGTGPR